MRTKYIISAALTAILLCSGCAQTISKDTAKHYAGVISDACKEHAQEATKRGYKYIPTYSRCIDNSLIYLKNKRLAREAEERGNNGRKRYNLYDIAKGLAKSEAKDRAQDIAKAKLKGI